MENIPLKVETDDILGQCLVATSSIPAGSVIVKETAALSSAMLLSTIQYKKGLHVNLPLNGFIWRTEHSCMPNAYLLVQSEDTVEAEGGNASVSLIATADIAQGEHVKYDYNTSEVVLSRSFPCGCGAGHCPGTVGGFYFLSMKQREELVKRLGDKVLSPAVANEWRNSSTTTQSV